MIKQPNKIFKSKINLMKHLLTILAATLLSLQVVAQTISIQGVLRDPSGKSVDDGFYKVVFKIYDASTGGTALWTDTYNSLATKHGVFQANLGENATLDGLAFDKSYYVGVTVENFAEMTPRIALTIYPYSKAILGQDNKFPSTGNIVLAKDSIIVQQGALKFEGADGRIVFNDGTSLNTADFAGPASGLLNPSSININADNDGDGTGAINFQINGATHGVILNNGTASFNGAVNVTTFLQAGDFLRVGTDTSVPYVTMGKDYVQTNANISSAGTLRINPGGGAVDVSSALLRVGKNDTSRGLLELYGDGSGLTGGGRINFHKAADYDGDGSETASEFWFLEALNDNLRIGNIFSNNNIMTFRQDGNIGIGGGAYDPQFDLAIGDHDTGIDWVQDGAFNLMSNGSQALTVGNNANIGIGDNTPIEAKLVIAGGNSYATTLGAYMDGNTTGTNIGQWGGGAWTSNNLSVYTTNQIASAGGFFVVSDERIKQIIGQSDSENDLNILNQLRVTDYQYIDKVNYGNKEDKKLIAQQVKQVYPKAIETRTSFIPDIFVPANEIVFDKELNELTITAPQKHGLVVGDRVRLLLSDKESEVAVLEVKDENTFIVKSEKEEKSLFIYGKQVNDFLNIDYDAISMLNVSATQELAKRTTDQEKRIAALEAENAELKKKLELVSTLEAKVNALLGIESKDATLLGQK